MTSGYGSVPETDEKPATKSQCSSRYSIVLMVVGIVGVVVGVAIGWAARNYDGKVKGMTEGEVRDHILGNINRDNIRENLRYVHGFLSLCIYYQHIKASIIRLINSVREYMLYKSASDDIYSKFQFNAKII